MFFNQDCNVDIAGADNTCLDERFNLLNLISAGGNNVTLLSSFLQSDLADQLAENDFLVVPDLEDSFSDCVITDPAFISPGARNVINQYVLNGGRIIVAGSSQNIEFLNMVLGLSLADGGFSNMGISLKNNDQSSGTPFADCPGSLPNLSATFMVISTLPNSKMCFYSNGNNASVAYFNMGEGSIIYLGYDFNDAGPGCDQEDSEWTRCILTSALDVAEFGPGGSRSIPTLSEWGIMILTLLLIIIGVTKMKHASWHFLSFHGREDV